MRILAGDNMKSTVISALRLLTDLLLTNEPFPVHSYGKYFSLESIDNEYHCLFVFFQDNYVIVYF